MVTLLAVSISYLRHSISRRSMKPVVQQEEQYEIWWYEDSRSDWVVVEDCWVDSDYHHEWRNLEPSIRILLFDASGVGMASSDLDWLSDGFCLRIQGSGTRCSSAEGEVFWCFENGTIGTVAVEEYTLDQVHYNWMNADRSLKSSDAKPKKIWYGFLTRAEHTYGLSLITIVIFNLIGYRANATSVNNVTNTP